MLEGGIAGDALQLVGHDPFDILLDPVVVFLYHFLHVIHSVIVHEAGDNGYLLICLLLFGYFPGIDDNLAVDTTNGDFQTSDDAGIIGMDMVNQFDCVTINLKEMFLKLE